MSVCRGAALGTTGGGAGGGGGALSRVTPLLPERPGEGSLDRPLPAAKSSKGGGGAGGGMDRMSCALAPAGGAVDPAAALARLRAASSQGCSSSVPQADCGLGSSRGPASCSSSCNCRRFSSRLRFKAESSRAISSSVGDEVRTVAADGFEELRPREGDGAVGDCGSPLPACRPSLAKGLPEPPECARERSGDPESDLSPYPARLATGGLRPRDSAGAGALCARAGAGGPALARLCARRCC